MSVTNGTTDASESSAPPPAAGHRAGRRSGEPHGDRERRRAGPQGRASIPSTAREICAAAAAHPTRFVRSAPRRRRRAPPQAAPRRKRPRSCDLGAAASLYPWPGTVTMILGCFGSGLDLVGAGARPACRRCDRQARRRAGPRPGATRRATPRGRFGAPARPAWRTPRASAEGPRRRACCTERALDVEGVPRKWRTSGEASSIGSSGKIALTLSKTSASLRGFEIKPSVWSDLGDSGFCISRGFGDNNQPTDRAA